MPSTVLVVDDQPAARRALAGELEDAGLTVRLAADGVEGWERFRRDRPDLVITDMVMPRSDGLELLARIRARSEVPVIVFSAHASVDAAVTALKAGAAEFVSSSSIAVDRLVELAAAMLGREGGAESADALEQRLAGRSRAMRLLRERVGALAPLRTPVLIRGEAGSGRDSVARALHELGSTADGPFVKLDAGRCSPEQRLPASGAVYLDLVENLPTAAQTRFAAWVAASSSGASAQQVRLLASSAGTLAERVASGAFQRELGHALLRFEIQLVPLRERIEDLSDLATSLMARIGRELGRRTVRLSASALDLLQRRAWPGNVAELGRVLEQAIAFSRTRELSRRVVEDVLHDADENVARIRRQHDASERARLLETLRSTGGNVTQAAARLGIGRSAVYYLIAKHRIQLDRVG